MRIFINFLSYISFFILVNSAHSQIDVYIDAGHGGSDPGKTSVHYPNLFEKDINLVVALKFVDHCNDLGDTYFISRIKDTTIQRKHRAYKANEIDAKAFISIHHNADLNTLITMDM